MPIFVREPTKLDAGPLIEYPDDSTSGLKAASTFFIHDEFKIPYFFGFTRVAKIATYNIESFLELAAALFDEMLSQSIKNQKVVLLGAARQEAIMQKLAQKHFKRISVINKNSADVINFLSEFCRFAREQTMRPNAPYTPGVTGIGISEIDYRQMINSYHKMENKNYGRLLEVFRSCIIHNYVTAKYDARQGKTGNRVVILYLNRLLCVHFDLPLGRGGWRHKTPKELNQWLDTPVQKKRRLRS